MFSDVWVAPELLPSLEVQHGSAALRACRDHYVLDAAAWRCHDHEHGNHFSLFSSRPTHSILKRQMSLLCSSSLLAYPLTTPRNSDRASAKSADLGGWGNLILRRRRERSTSSCSDVASASSRPSSRKDEQLQPLLKAATSAAGARRGVLRSFRCASLGRYPSLQHSCRSTESLEATSRHSVRAKRQSSSLELSRPSR